MRSLPRSSVRASGRRQSTCNLYAAAEALQTTGSALAFSFGVSPPKPFGHPTNAAAGALEPDAGPRAIHRGFLVRAPRSNSGPKSSHGSLDLLTCARRNANEYM